MSRICRGGAWRIWQGKIKWMRKKILFTKILLMISSKCVNLFSKRPKLLEILVEARQRKEEERRRHELFLQTQQIFLLRRMTN